MYKLSAFTAIALVCASGVVVSLPAAADERVVREYRFDVSTVRQIEFHAGVGSIQILPAEGNEVQLVLDIEGTDTGWFSGNRDVSGVGLVSAEHSDRLVLEQTAEHTKTHWTIRLPAVAMTKIDMGVGEIDAEFIGTALSIELGVGDVQVSAPRASAGNIDLSVGVGEASLQGGSRVNTQRSIVSHEVRGSGEGTQDIAIEAGVGSIDLVLL